MPPGWPRQARSVDRLSAVPLHWRPTMEALIQGKNQVMQEPEEYPMAVQGESLQSAYEWQAPGESPCPTAAGQELRRWWFRRWRPARSPGRPGP